LKPVVEHSGYGIAADVKPTSVVYNTPVTISIGLFKSVVL
jgi:hypothetical protein